MTDYSYIDFDKFEPTKYPNWGYQLSDGVEAIIYYPTNEVFELGEIKVWHGNATHDMVVLLDADAGSNDIIIDYIYDSYLSIEDAIQYFSNSLGYELE